MCQTETDILGAIPSSRRETLISLYDQLEGFAKPIEAVRSAAPKKLDARSIDLDEELTQTSQRRGSIIVRKRSTHVRSKTSVMGYSNPVNNGEDS
jgi:hypothetical protein